MFVEIHQPEPSKWYKQNIIFNILEKMYTIYVSSKVFNFDKVYDDYERKKENK